MTMPNSSKKINIKLGNGLTYSLFKLVKDPSSVGIVPES